MGSELSRARELYDTAMQFNSAGEFERAVAHLRECLTLQQQEQGQEHKNTLFIMSCLASALDQAGQHAEAVLVARQCLELLQ